MIDYLRNNILKLFLKITLLVLIVTFEKVVGVPILFLTFVAIFLITARTHELYTIFIFSGLLLAIIYDQPISLALLTILFFYSGFTYGHPIVESNIKRFFSLLLLSSVFIIYNSQIIVSNWILVYIVLSLLISYFLTTKLLFSKYGFLGIRVNKKHSFFR
jgi:hypothetical protein